MVPGLLGYFVVVPLAQDAILRDTLLMETASARDARLEQNNEEHRRWLDSTAPLLGSPTHTYSVTYDTCYDYPTTSPGKWLPNGNELECLLMYADFYELPKENDAVNAAIEACPDDCAAASVMVPEYLNAAGVDDAWSGAALNYEYDNLWATAPGMPSTQTVLDKTIVPARLYLPDPLRGRNIVQETGQAKLDPAKQYLVLIDTRKYYANALGCGVGRPLYCSSPLEH